MTYTYKELDNVIDISHLKIKVGHPDETDAYISKIGNLRLSNGLTLYGLMVIPEYYVTLDLNLKNILGIGEQCEGLYYYSDKDYVLNVFKDSLNFDKSDYTGCCEICQRAKKIREPFPLSDHKSKNLGDLVHLDVWGPYKVASLDVFRFFLTVVYDYTRAVWGKSDSSSSFESDNNINTADFRVDYGNDADSSNDFVVTQDEEVATLEENVFSESNLDQNPSSSQSIQNVRRSSRQSVFPKNYNDFVTESKVKYGLEKY
nr:ribonuclease H-like domain-containing protein [Tanacetum cinerariifolium]